MNVEQEARMDDLTYEVLAKLQKDAGIPNLPTPLTYQLRRAVSGEGERAYDWSDKPHRLLYDACREIEELTPRLAEVEAERDALRAIVEKHQKRAEWFYVTGYEQDECEMSIGDVLERMDLGVGFHVACVAVATPLPSIWCAVRILSDDEADELETDDRTVFTEHATEAEARAALGAKP